MGGKGTAHEVGAVRTNPFTGMEWKGGTGPSLSFKSVQERETLIISGDVPRVVGSKFGRARH